MSKLTNCTCGRPLYPWNDRCFTCGREHNLYSHRYTADELEAMKRMLRCSPEHAAAMAEEEAAAAVPIGACEACHAEARYGHRAGCPVGIHDVSQSTPAPLWPIYEFPCECGRTIRGTDRERGKRCEHERTYLHCGGCDMIHEADAAFVLGHPCPMCCWPLVAAEVPAAYNPSAADVARAVERIKATAEPKPPTLREWLGDRASELGRWAEVLREQPVPCGFITQVTWDMAHGQWALRFQHRFGINAVHLRASEVSSVLCHAEPGALDTYRMMLFTRHPDVAPTAKLRTWFGNEEEV
jgi:hypothetical protein